MPLTTKLQLNWFKQLFKQCWFFFRFFHKISKNRDFCRFWGARSKIERSSPILTEIQKFFFHWFSNIINLWKKLSSPKNLKKSILTPVQPIPTLRNWPLLYYCPFKAWWVQTFFLKFVFLPKYGVICVPWHSF